MKEVSKNQSSVQLSPSPCQGGVKDHSNADAAARRLQVINRYLHTRDGLWRLLACMPRDISVVDALRLAPAVIFGTSQGQEGGEL